MQSDCDALPSSHTYNRVKLSKVLQHKKTCQVINCVHADTMLRLFADFPEWAEVMTAWGDKMLAAVHTVAQMSAIGFDLPAGAFTERMAHGPHLLAPTGDSLC